MVLLVHEEQVLPDFKEICVKHVVLGESLRNFSKTAMKQSSVDIRTRILIEMSAFSI